VEPKKADVTEVESRTVVIRAWQEWGGEKMRSLPMRGTRITDSQEE
jgi:hypothetical protein